MQLSDAEKMNIRNKAEKLQKKMFMTRTHDEVVVHIEKELTATYKEAKRIAYKEFEDDE